MALLQLTTAAVIEEGGFSSREAKSSFNEFSRGTKNIAHIMKYTSVQMEAAGSLCAFSMIVSH